ncbi:hypothetical protein ACSG5Z_00200 [Bacillus sp. 'calajunan']
MERRFSPTTNFLQVMLVLLAEKLREGIVLLTLSSITRNLITPFHDRRYPCRNTPSNRPDLLWQSSPRLDTNVTGNA